MIHISAKDLVQGEWACKDLETFHCAIKDIPRPDIKTRKNGQPLVGRMHRGVSMEESLRVQRLVYEQLGRLRKLRELVLGYRSCDGDERFGGFVTDEDLGWEQGITEADYYSADSPTSPVGSISSSSINDGSDSNEGKMQDEEDEDMPTEMLYDCLAMSLESGLELLGGLTELKWLSLEGTSHCVKNVERKWMANQWPGLFLEDELEEEDDRGGSGGGGVLRDVFWKKFMICGYHATEPWYNNWEDIEANALILLCAISNLESLQFLVGCLDGTDENRAAFIGTIKESCTNLSEICIERRTSSDYFAEPWGSGYLGWKAVKIQGGGVMEPGKPEFGPRAMEVFLKLTAKLEST
ncbi:hypothetical protein BGZ90_003348 [Linnemannia elongata]|nr:hypothetical protein BGZ90_003348 [Linnemannia elongata]